MWRSIQGQVTLRVQGADLERFLNRCTELGIALHTVRLETQTSLTLSIAMEAFGELRAPLRETRSRVQVLEKRGLPVLRLRLRRKRAWALGLVTMLLLLWIATSRIWIIDIVGVQSLPEDVLRARLNTMGVRPGCYKGDIRNAELKQALLRELPDTSWVGIQLNGVRLTVEIVESVRPPERLDTEQPTDVIAAKGGLIEKISVLEGVALVKPGDIVRAGEVLIRGERAPSVRGELEAGTPVHARGLVTARVFYNATERESTWEVVSVPTGRVAEKRTLSLCGWRIPLHAGDVFAEFDAQRNDVALLDGLFLPVRVESETQIEVTREKQEREWQLVKELVCQKAMETALGKLPDGAQIVDKQVEYGMITEGQMVAAAYVQTLESIGVEQMQTQ